MEENKNSLLSFPCDFTIKIMGKTNASFEEIVLKIVRQHYPAINSEKIQKRPSKNGNYLALSIELKPQSQAELDALYISLSQHTEVLMCI